MANLDELALSLKTLIKNEDFWLKLRFNGELDRDIFNKVLSLLNEYAQQATSESKIHKSVARWAFDLYHELIASSDHATMNDWPQRDDLDNAITELVYVLDILF